jgi:hypothetical protein
MIATGRALLERGESEPAPGVTAAAGIFQG